MSETDPCVLCEMDAETVPTIGTSTVWQKCPRCGEFQLSAILRRVSQVDKLTKLSGWVRNRNTLGEIPTLTDKLVSGIIASPLPGVVERADCLLKHVISGQEFLGEHFTDTLDSSFYAVTYSINTLEMKYFLNFLSDEGFFKKNAEHDFEVTPKGYMRYEDLQSQSSPSAQGFVAMWFDPSVQPAYDDGLALGIRRAGYDPLRVDSVEHVGKIDDEIIAQIKTLQVCGC